MTGKSCIKPELETRAKEALRFRRLLEARKKNWRNWETNKWLNGKTGDVPGAVERPTWKEKRTPSMRNVLCAPRRPKSRTSSE